MAEFPAVVSGRPQRRCVGCRRSGDRSALLRFVVAEVDGVAEVVLDERRIRPGRGAWLHPDLQCWALAQRRSALARALRTTVEVDHARLARVAGVPSAPEQQDSTKQDSTKKDRTTRRPARDVGTST